MSERDAAGRFVAGYSGNPGGRSATRCRALAQETTEEAIARLTELMRSEDPDVSLRAIGMLLDRGWGKPAVAITGDDGGPVQFNAVHTIAEAERLALEALRSAGVVIDGEAIDDDHGGAGHADCA